MAEGAHFESEYFLSLSYLPPAQNEERVKGWVFDGASQSKSAAERALDYFRARVNAFEDIFGSLFQIHRLKATLIEDHPFTRPLIPTYLHDFLATEDFVGGMSPRVGSKVLRILAVDGFPRLSYPGILGALDNLPIEYRWHTRAILLGPEEARGLLDKTRRKSRSKIRGWKD